MDENSQETISGEPELFAELLTSLDDIPFNDFIVELMWFHMKEDESSTSDAISFKISSMTGMLWKIQDSYLSAKVSAETIVDFIPRPLNTWAKLVELSINGVAVTVTQTDNLKVFSMINILFEKKGRHDNGFVGYTGKRSYLHEITTDNHTGAKK